MSSPDSPTQRGDEDFFGKECEEEENYYGEAEDEEDAD